MLRFKHSRQAAARGSALFIVLMAVALFAALSYVVTRSGRGGGGGPSREKIVIQAAQIIEMGEALHYAANRMLLLGGASGGSLYFYEIDGTDCVTGVNCFSAPNGGAFDYRLLFVPTDAFSQIDIGYGAGQPLLFLYAKADKRAYIGMGQDSVADVFLEVVPLTVEVCNQIDQKLGLGTAAPLNNAIYSSVPPGADPAGTSLLDTKALFSTTSAPQSGCFLSSSGLGFGIYFQILAAN